MSKAVDYYNKNAKEYCDNTLNVDMSITMNRFVNHLQNGGVVLDAGCGSGRDSISLIERGYRVVAIDASKAMCEQARANASIPVTNVRFEDIAYEKEFDGIWACASLLHTPKSKIVDVISKLRDALKDDGVIYMSFKYGEGERFTEDGRFYNDYKPHTIAELLTDCNLELIELFVTKDRKPNSEPERWLNVIARKFQ